MSVRAGKTGVTRAQFIETARSYLGIPYINQGRDRAGTDCGGLLLMIGRELGLTQLEHLGYSNSPDGETFERLLEENCDRLTEREWANPQPGDVLAINFGEGIQHTAIVTETEPRLKVIHAKRPAGEARSTGGRAARGVIEQYLYGRDLRGWQNAKRTYRVRGIID